MKSKIDKLCDCDIFMVIYFLINLLSNIIASTLMIVICHIIVIYNIFCYRSFEINDIMEWPLPLQLSEFTFDEDLLLMSIYFIEKP